jgi:putative photosynthetic complex assembly protein 2
MVQRAVPALFVVAVWWLSTAIVLGMVWLRRSTFRLSISIFSALALVGLAGIYLTSRSSTVGAAYGAFACAVFVWGWHELTFLLGAVTGPRRVECPKGAKSWRRFRFATGAVIHHELALAATLIVIAALGWREPNQVGTYTFLVLWLMRLSAKFNVYLGVPNLSEEFVPEHLRYLTSYFRRAPINPLMPFSLLASSATLIWMGYGAATSASSAFAITGRTLVMTILGLAVLEHLFMALPVPDAVLWRWAMRRKPSEGVGLRDLPIEAP